MGGINSLNGLNKVSVDFQPTITTNVQNTGNANQPQPGADAVPEEAPQLGNAKVREAHAGFVRTSIFGGDNGREERARH